MSLERALELYIKEHAVKKRDIKETETISLPKHLRLGRMGEDIACEYLVSNDYEIIDRNVRYRWGEIDIIAKDSETCDLVFVEVRTRTIGKIMPPDKTVGPEKLKKLIRSCRTWVENKQYSAFWRIDLLAITVKEDNSYDTEHIKNITEAIL
ncbi:MAG: YraN family protein [Synergistaceae bacterium]|jgi:putative endonuclease|nr:YraN family protein [Synergistaceae bacterium]